jgi:hypothetical protein
MAAVRGRWRGRWRTGRGRASREGGAVEWIKEERGKRKEKEREKGKGKKERI